MGEKEKDAFFRAAQAIGRVVTMHPKLVPEEPEDTDGDTDDDNTGATDDVRPNTGSNPSRASG